MKKLQQRGQGGFTLIELLVVIAILGILAAVVVFAVGGSTQNANEAACKTEMATLKTAIAAAETAEAGGLSAGTDYSDYIDSSSPLKYLEVDGSGNIVSQDTNVVSDTCEPA